MKIGIFGINIGSVANPDSMWEIVRKSEEVGMESIWTGEHVIIPHDYKSRYPYNDGGKLAAKEETNFVDPLITLSHIAGQTNPNIMPWSPAPSASTPWAMSGDCCLRLTSTAQLLESNCKSASV